MGRASLDLLTSEQISTWQTGNHQPYTGGNAHPGHPDPENINNFNFRFLLAQINMFSSSSRDLTWVVPSPSDPNKSFTPLSTWGGKGLPRCISMLIVHLDAGNDSGSFDQVYKGSPIVSLLVERLVEKNHL